MLAASRESREIMVMIMVVVVMMVVMVMAVVMVVMMMEMVMVMVVVVVVIVMTKVMEVVMVVLLLIRMIRPLPVKSKSTEVCGWVRGLLHAFPIKRPVTRQFLLFSCGINPSGLCV